MSDIKNEEQTIDAVELEAVEVVETKEAKSTKNAISISHENQGLDLADHNQLTAFIKQMIHAKAIPKHLKTVAEVLSAWNYAAQLNLPPQVSLRNVAVIEGTPSLFGDLPLALVQRHEEFVSYEEFTFNKDFKKICFENKNLNDEIFGGTVFLQRKGMKEPQSFSFTMEDAKRAGLLGRNNPWKTYPQVMITRRARIIAIRALFADAITGASIAEDFGNAPDLMPMKDVTESETDRFNEKYAKKKEIKESVDVGQVQAATMPDMQTTI